MSGTASGGHVMHRSPTTTPESGSLRWRIMIAFMMVVAVAILGVAIAAVIGSQRGIAAVERDDRSDLALSVAGEISRAYLSTSPSPGTDLSDVDLSNAEALAANSGAQLSVISDARGQGPAERGRNAVVAPVIVDNQVIGFARLTFAAPPSASGQSIAWTWIFVAMIVTAVVAALAAWMLSRWLTRPLTQLSQSVRAFGRGDRTVRAPIGAPGEIGGLASAFDDMTAQIDQGERARRAMASDVAHELRTPLAALQAGLEELRDGLAPASSERLASLHDQSLRLSRLVDDLEKLAEAESPNVSVHLRDLDLTHEINEAVRATQSLLDSAGIAVDVHSQGQVHVWADPDRVAQIMANLLSNSARYCRAGDRVTLTVESELDVGVLEVSDTGPGMAPEDAARAFDRLYRGSGATGTEGSGVGLSIVQALVTAQHGRAEISSTLGGGTTLRVTLPLANQE